MKFEQIDFTEGKPSGLTISVTAQEGSFLSQLLYKQSKSSLESVGLELGPVFQGLYSGFDSLFKQGLDEMMEDL